MIFYRADFESRHFSFHAYGSTKEKAIQALKEGLDAHGSGYGTESNWWHNYESDINITEIQLNGCYRDYDLIKEIA